MTTDTKHTQGKWSVKSPRPERFPAYYIESDAGRYIASVRIGADNPASDNARLVSAAPDLLAALQALLKNHVQLVTSGDCGHWNVETEAEVIQARAAIAKATQA